MELLTKNKEILDDISKSLIENEKMTGIELLDIIKKYDPDLVSTEKYDLAQSQVADALQENLDEMEEKVSVAVDQAVADINTQLQGMSSTQEKMDFIDGAVE